MRNKKDGFTLVELVVVIAIIGVLAAVVTPKVSLALTKSKDTKALANLNTIRTAAKMLYAETGETLYSLAPGLGTKVPGTGEDKVLTEAQIDALVDRKYLDETAKNLTSPFEVGVNMPEGQCSGGALKSDASMESKPIHIIFEADGVGLKFGDNAGETTTNVDASCKVWSEK